MKSAKPETGWLHTLPLDVSLTPQESVWEPEREAALQWPQELLERFSLGMAGHGMCISRVLMASDRAYALQQLVHGHNLGDASVRALSVQLLHCLEARQIDVPLLH